MKQYRSKISVGLLVFVSIFPVFFAILFFLGKIDFVGFILTFLISFSPSYLMILSIRYQIDSDILRVKMFFMSHKIPIKNITKITKSRSILSAPAASIDRLKIHFNKYDYTLISPKNKQQFIADLLAVNPNIEVEKSLSDKEL